MEVSLGQRVVRGPDWEWGDQDGGEGFVGTVAGLEEGVGVIVQWDMGQRCRYRCGRGNKFDLRVLDCAQTGAKHQQSAVCSSCSQEVWGFLWKCIHCFEGGGGLCSNCYMTGKHSLFHSFVRIDRDGGPRVKVRPRGVSYAAKACGIYPGAVVMRGYDWTWKDQDGGEGNLGDVVEIQNWKNESVRSIVQVMWKGGMKKNVYRIGYKGKADLKCETPTVGGKYYPSHLPVLGGEVARGGSELTAGDKVRVDCDQERWRDLQKDHGDWDDLMAEFIGTTGVIQHITDSGDLIVSYPGQAIFPVNPQAVTKVEGVVVYRVGDAVKVSEDKSQVSREQKGHGGWREEMAESLGQSGRVVKVLPSGDIQVAVGDRRWVYSPSCLQPASSLEINNQDTQNGGKLSELVRGQLESLVKQSSPYLVVAASAAGDLPTLKDYLNQNPEQVDVKVKDKTGLLVATAEGWPEVVKLLLQFKANVNKPDEEGDTALHYCAHLDREEIAQQLLAQDADPNAQNNSKAFPLLYAVALGNYGVMRLLLASGRLNHTLQEQDGNTALHVAVAAHRSEAVRALLDAGATPTVANSNHLTPILAAATTGFYLGLELFIGSHPDEVRSQSDEDGNTALHLAAANNHLDLVWLLAEKEACDVNAANKTKQETALHIAAREGHTRIIEYLLVRCKANPDTTDADGHTSLQLLITNKDCIKTPSEYSPLTLQISRELAQSQSSPANYMATGCLLVQYGASFNKENLTNDFGCSTYFVTLLVSYSEKRPQS